MNDKKAIKGQFQETSARADVLPDRRVTPSQRFLALLTCSLEEENGAGESQEENLN